MIQCLIDWIDGDRATPCSCIKFANRPVCGELLIFDTNQQFATDRIARDVHRDGERRPMLQQMLKRAPLQTDNDIRVLDVGAGYGVVTEEVLRRFPLARVTL